MAKPPFHRYHRGPPQHPPEVVPSDRTDPIRRSDLRARRSERLSVVLTRTEVQAVLQQLQGVPWLMASLMCGAVLRLLECCQLRVQDIDFERDLARQRGSVELPWALAQKYPTAALEWPLQ